MTVRDEERYLERAVRSVLDNGHEPGVELAIAVGPSGDRTAEVAAALAEDPRVTVVDNPTGLTPQGLNLAIAATLRQVVVRVDGHTELPRGYISRAVQQLADTGAANVGGQMVPVGEGAVQRAVAAAMSSPFGIGGARFHVGGQAGPQESVFLGVFRRTALEAVGGFDEHFSRAQDWELNRRLRQAGYVVWFDPELRVEYRPRRSLGALARQFHGSGRWRRQVVRRHPGTASLRYLAAPAMLLSLAAGAALAVAGAVAGWPWLCLLGAVPWVAYAAGLVGAAIALAGRTGAKGAVVTPVVLATMHLSWGAGFLRGLR